MTPPDLLRTIVAGTRRITEVRREREPLAQLERRAVNRAPRGDRFVAALSEAGRFNVIAECKRRSPSKGVLAETYDPVPIARQYEQGGAAALSVLTEPTFFDGTLDHLSAVRAAVSLPLLRKDFIVDEYQLLEARAAGADAVLLIVAALEDAELRALLRQAEAWRLACLVEAHQPEEVKRAIDAGARIVGVNSRNLRTLTVDPAVLDAAATLLPPTVIAVAESGIRSRADIDRLSAAGYKAFLVGERLITQPDPGAALRELRGRG